MTDDRSGLPVAVMASPAELDAARAMADDIDVALLGVRQFLRDLSRGLWPGLAGEDSSTVVELVERGVRQVEENEVAQVLALLRRLASEAERKAEEASRADA